ncbi:hypothetical protein M0R89_19135 (plasmid) [Halorussus limi]|uniref:Uncharacterized protein n=1 Tax=Halorussus limi TaxID=2938695 RepID=A0A8U0I0D9_9EURY|nr:hypothetical protein [Halorussus limi]UPV76647.1 hypothetical protein M0R89_19135 [Halorussus limi]
MATDNDERSSHRGEFRSSAANSSQSITSSAAWASASGSSAEEAYSISGSARACSQLSKYEQPFETLLAVIDLLGFVESFCRRFGDN